MSIPPIPYGWSDFASIRQEDALYVDKTRYLHDLEAHSYAFLNRPRRFGKSCWVSLLENYYDRCRADRFEGLFTGTDIGEEPTGIRDYIQGEKALQGFIAAYLNISDFFVCHTECELNKGFADICLEPLLVRYPGIGHGYVIETKYLKRGDGTDDARVLDAATAAENQLLQYLGDERLARQYPTVRFTGLALVFRGWEISHSSAVDAHP